MQPTIAALVEQMIAELQSAMNDVPKHYDGNNAAGTRLRNAMESVKKQAQSVRREVSFDKSARKAG